jgi:hypothetical protein
VAARRRQRGSVAELVALLRKLPAKAKRPGKLPVAAVHERVWQLWTEWLPRPRGGGWHSLGFFLADAALNPGGSQALHYAASAGAAGLTRDLVFVLGARAGVPGLGGRTPAQFAEEHGHAGLAAWLRRAAEQKAALRP